MIKASYAEYSSDFGTNVFGSSVDPDEIAHFNAMAQEWWDPKGSSAPLHAMASARLSVLREQLCTHFARDPLKLRTLTGLEGVDVGCGGGLVSEPLTRMGLRMTGVDAAARNIQVAKAHAAQSGLDIVYRAADAETLVREGQTFDVCVSLEVVEHVANVPAFLAACRQLLKPGGLFAFSTLNRTARSFLAAIVGAEWVLRTLPRGTHDWRKFITPQEMQAALAQAGFKVQLLEGLSFDLRTRAWTRSNDVSINYIGVAVAQ
jgi:2-polyprenyl-6-hydroxyphenyl methylase/3-demethylubiquinone-9 3-methyltransferase